MLSLTKSVILATGFAAGLLVLPFGVLAWAQFIDGHNFSIFEMLGWVLGGVVAAILGLILVILLWIERKWQGLVSLLVLIVLVSVGWVPVTWYENYLRRPYDREEVAFSDPEAPTVDFSGIWVGSWRDERQSFREPIILKLKQDGSSVSGEIVAGSGREFDVIEGVVSGNQLNLYYNVGGGEWARPGGGTLIGEAGDRKVSGTYYAHERPKRGWSRDGPWEATQLDLSQIQ